MARRGENIYKRKDKRYEGRYIKGHKPDGKPRYGYVYGSKYGEVQAELIALKLKYRGQKKNGAERFCGLFSDYLIAWLLSVAETVKASTLAGYRRMIGKYICPALGDKPLGKLNQADISGFADDLKNRNLSDGTRRNILCLLLAVLKQAAKDGDIDADIIKDIILPTAENKKASALTKTEQKNLENTVAWDARGIAILLALYTGMRLGEICALRWVDIDLIEGLIHVRQTVQRLALGGGKTALHIGTPKTPTSRRDIPIPDKLLDYLRVLQSGASGEYVVTETGKPADPRTIQYRFYALLCKAGIRKINFHMLRHTFAVRCLELKMDVVTLSQLLGHASAKMTLDVYGDSLLEHKKQEIQALNQLCSFGMERRTA